MSERKDRNLQIDVRRLVAYFGGRQPLATKLQRAGSDIRNVRVVDGWLLRGRIPATRLMEIARVAYAENRRFDILEFQVPKGTDRQEQDHE